MSAQCYFWERRWGNIRFYKYPATYKRGLRHTTMSKSWRQAKSHRGSTTSQQSHDQKPPHGNGNLWRLSQVLTSGPGAPNQLHWCSTPEHGQGHANRTGTHTTGNTTTQETHTAVTLTYGNYLIFCNMPAYVYPVLTTLICSMNTIFRSTPKHIDSRFLW